jgi:hypothetical protein
MTIAGGWICGACWKANRPQDPLCFRCKTPRDADKATVEASRAAAAAAAAKPEAIPDIVIALPVVVFRGYARAWLRGGLGVVGFLFLIALGGVTDPGYLLLTGGLGAGLVVCGLMAGEVAEGMRAREVWAFVIGVGLAAAGGVGSVVAFETLAPGLVSPAGIRWVSLIVFGGAGAAAIAGLVLMFLRRERA